MLQDAEPKVQKLDALIADVERKIGLVPRCQSVKHFENEIRELRAEIGELTRLPPAPQDPGPQPGDPDTTEGRLVDVGTGRRVFVPLTASR